MPDSVTCSIDGCERPYRSRGWCKVHYERWRTTGSTDSVRGVDLDPVDYFWSIVDVGHPLGCWNWTGTRRADGYGYFRRLPGTALVHRIAYKLLRGEIPAGQQLDHLCRNTSCVNPDHLEPVTAKVNTLRGYAPCARQARRTSCIRGHQFTPENTYTPPGDSKRYCRTCRRQRRRDQAGMAA